MQENYKCSKAVMQKCKEYKYNQCDGTYFGTDCQCAKDNQKHMPGTERNELLRYRTTGHTPEECAAAFKELSAYRDAEQDKKLIKLPIPYDAETIYTVENDCVRGHDVDSWIISSDGIATPREESIFDEHDYFLVPGREIYYSPEAAEAALKDQEVQK